MVELARRHGGLEVRGHAERLRLLDLAGAPIVHGSIESTGWHRLFLPDGPGPLEFPVAGRLVYAPADEVVARNLERLGATVRPYRPLPLAGERTHFSDHDWRELTGGEGRAPDPHLEFQPPPPRHGSWVLHPGSGSARKNRPAGELAELARRAPRPPVVIAGPADERPVAEFLSALGREVEVRREPDPLSLARFLAGARAFVGHDSGPTHLAAALGIPTAALFTASDPALWAPRGPRVTILEPGTPAVAILSTLGENGPDAGRSPRPYPL